MQQRLSLVLLVAGMLIAPRANAQITLKLTNLVPNGGRVSWYKGSAAHNLIAFDVGVDPLGTLQEVFTIAPNGAGAFCVTCGTAVPQGFRGQPVWHPGGNALVIQAANERSSGTFYNSVLWGFDNDLWWIGRDGSYAQRIWRTPEGGAVLHPQFSPDGTKLMFAERTPWPSADPYQNWQLRIADFDVSKYGLGKLSNVRAIQPNGLGFYESHEFKGNNEIVYSYGPPGSGIVDDVFLAFVDGTAPVNLTNTPGVWDEHGHLSPTYPSLMAYMSSSFDPGAGADNLRTDLYLSLLGQGAGRVTFFNSAPGVNHVVKDLDWDRSGSRIAFLVSGDWLQAPAIFILSFSQAQLAQLDE